jgi:putative ABC transport system permease protein
MYGALLRLLPASFRNEYGSEMRAVHARRRREAAGPLGLGLLWLETLWDLIATAASVHAGLFAQDARYAFRSFRNAPGFTLTAALVAALGVGATTAVFSVTDHVLVRPLPFREPQRLVKLWQDQTARGYSRMELSPANYRDWKRAATSFESMAVWSNVSANLSGDGEPERLEGTAVSSELLPLLGVRPLIGRAFAEADDSPRAPATVILSHGLWLARFGGDPGVLGRRLILNDEPHEVIGVMPADFRFPRRDTRIWTATRFPEEAYADRTNTCVYGIGRLRPGVSLEQARAEMSLIAARLERAYPENAKTGASLVRLRDEVAPQARLLLKALFGAALCVLLIACANLASLLLARALVRRHELAVRTALGAGRERLLRQLLTESLLLATLGGTLGVLLAFTATPLVARLVPTSLPIAEAPSVDLRVLAFAAAMTVAIAVAFGVAPAWRALRDVDAASLHEGSRGGVGGRRERLRGALVMAEVTLSVVLLVSAGLLIRALWRVQSVDPGFRADGVLTLRTTLPLPKYNPTLSRHRFYATVLDGVRGLPGVESAAYTSFLPMVMRGGIWKVEIPGRVDAPGEGASVSMRFVTPGYFETMGVPLRAGRDVSDSDTRESPFVAIVSESFARSVWPGQDALGRRFKLAFFDRTVVGVAGDVRVRGIERDSEPQVYLPDQQVPDGGVIWYAPKDLAIRATVDPATLLPQVRRIVAQADPRQPISDVRTLDDVVRSETGARTAQVRVLIAFAGAALLLAGVGIHGLLAFVVRSRSQEIGVRVALGAGPRDVLALVLRQAARLAGAGLAAGLVLSYAAGRTMQALLFGVSPHDGVTFAAAISVSALMAGAGSVLPALRALRVDPLTVMRAE